MWLLVALVSLLAVFAFLLWAPLEVVFDASFRQERRLHVRMRWCHGLITRDIAGKAEPGKEVKEGVRGKRKRGKGWPGFADAVRLLRTRGLLKRAGILLKDLLKAVRIRNLLADLKVGLDSPADTGMLFACIGPPLFWLGPRLPVQLNIQPVFEQATFSGHAQGEVSTRPLALLLPLLKFIFSPAALRALGQLARSKWRRRRR